MVPADTLWGLVALGLGLTLFWGAALAVLSPRPAEHRSVPNLLLTMSRAWVVTACVFLVGAWLLEGPRGVQQVLERLWPWAPRGDMALAQALATVLLGVFLALLAWDHQQAPRSPRRVDRVVHVLAGCLAVLVPVLLFSPPWALR